MSHELSLNRDDRPQATLSAFPAPILRAGVAPAKQYDTQPPETDEVDDLLPARGLLFSAAIGIGLWVLLGSIVWLIAR